MRIFTRVKEVVAATGVLEGRQRRALDSTVLDDAVATQDTVTQIISAIRRVIREVPGAQETASEWCRAHDYTDPGKPKIAWNDEAARAVLVDALVTDALNLLARLPEQNLGEKAANAVGLLALVAGQDVEPETGLFTAIALTSGYGADSHEAAVALDLLDEEDGELTVLGDSAYGTATCPAGHAANLGQVKADGARTAQFKRLCTDCPLRERCTNSKTGRTLNVHPQHELLTAARAQAATDPVWQDEYRRWRPPVERAIAWLVAKGNRRVPYHGVVTNNIWLHHRAAALNLRRLINLGLTRTSGTWHLTATPA